jgi:hypothetical protein
MPPKAMPGTAAPGKLIETVHNAIAEIVTVIERVAVAIRDVARIDIGVQWPV